MSPPDAPSPYAMVYAAGLPAGAPAARDGAGPRLSAP